MACSLDKQENLMQGMPMMPKSVLYFEKVIFMFQMQKYG